MISLPKRLCAVFVLVASTAVCADIDLVRDSVVLINTDSSQGGGVIVGSNSKSVYVVTALHVVSEVVGNQVTLRGNLKVTFNSARDRSFDGRVFENVKSDLDLAVVAVDIAVDDPVRPTLRRLGVRETSGVAKLTAVGSICHAGGESWVTNAGVNKIQGKNLNTFSISNIGIAEGCSGGPLLDEDGRLLGIITSIGPAQASALTADATFDAIGSWNIPRNLAEKDDSCWCVIRSNPDGANVLIDGSNVGVTPLKVPMKEGAVSKVRLLKDGYNEIVHDLSCGARELTLTMQTADCKVAVTSLPSDASVSVDGHDSGTTPTAVRVPQGGTVAMRVEKDGYATVEKVVDCQRSSVTVKLEKNTGTVKIGYSGDAGGCSLNLFIVLGDEKKIHPTSNLYTVQNVPLGDVSYEISGRIGCPMQGVCNVSGGGTVTVHDGDTLQVVWHNTGYAACDVTLVNPNE